ncbi:MAG: hypothetical protein BWY78_00331 [Alphaproteobacteria bacterium ADurb.Bin438]|nr:MAG: hypothetical protein BWY78_00331 [Alphaproteobacteria bacterium ADurb.Bin438]
MSDALKTLIRVAKWELDERRRTLTDLLKFEDQVLEEKRRLEKEKEAQDNLVASSLDFAFSYDLYLKGYLEKQANLDKTLSEIRDLIEKARNMLEEAFMTLKTYEISDKNKEKKEAYELELKNQKNLDEMGLNSYRIRNKKSEE